MSRTYTAKAVRPNVVKEDDRPRRWTHEEVQCTCYHHEESCMFDFCPVCDLPEFRAPWICKDGTQVRIEDMSDKHLMNTIRLIERAFTIAVGRYLVGPAPQGEMAQDAFEAEYDALEEEGPGAVHPQYEVLCDEARERGIDTRKTRDARRLGYDLSMLNRIMEAKAERRV